jgi:glycyl-tRNA synthetase beta chain
MLPQGQIGAIVGIADRIDTISGCFGIGQTPTGTTDPFGLRRLALGIIHIIERHRFAISLEDLIRASLTLFADKLTEEKDEISRNVIGFIMGRYSNDKISKGVPAETVDAVTSVSFDDIIDCTLKIEALQSVSSQDSFPLLAGAFKRVMNIIKDHDNSVVDEGLLTADAEKNLFSAYKDVYINVKPCIAARRYEEAMRLILKMKEPVDRFFDEVLVMVEDENVKMNRLALLSAVAGLFLQIGDFSKMYAINK